jgi:TATA-box binding protein (TBP) (component of TFIID and TFIIIB)
MDSYFQSKIRALPDSSEELSTQTLDLNHVMTKVIDSVDQPPLPPLVPPMFDAYTLSVDSSKVKDADNFAKWYEEWKVYQQEKKEYEVRESLARDDYILQEEEQRETLTLRDSKTGTCIDVTIENYVYSTHFKNKYTGQPYKFNLAYLAQKALDKGITYIKTKFAKIDFRTPWGSALIFESGGMIETGAKKRETSKKLLDHILNFLRYGCGYKNIAVSKRICQNVVMTGKTSHNICLNLLRSKYSFVEYCPDICAGAMIRIEDLDKFYQMASTESYNDYEDDDDHEFEVDPDVDRINEEEQAEEVEIDDGDDEEEEDEEEDDFEDDDEEADDTIIKNNTTDAFYYEYLKSTSDPGLSTLNKKNNATILLFEQGALICVGNKSRKKAKEALTKIKPILESCRDTPENLTQEKILASLASNSASSIDTLSSLARGSKTRKSGPRDKRNPKKAKLTT